MRRLQVSEGRRMTYRDLAQMAGTSERTMAEWMRGATSPMAMNGLLNLMSALKADDAIQVLEHWRAAHGFEVRLVASDVPPIGYVEQ